MIKRTPYEKTLDRLAALLREKPRTAREIAKLMKCCRPTAYQRIEALKAGGYPVFTRRGSAQPRADGSGDGTGPRPIVYGVRVFGTGNR